ncbi:MAG: hypothetical protein HOH43_25400 [Candidatus Latescibacteria bacterium]|jgi:2-dehydro-3-deoxygluconokinase|nr:hypothetical protein [Candidatus Latescibacterota bacterium]
MTESQSRYDLVTFGDGFLRLVAPGFGRIEQVNSVQVHVAGQSLETAVAASRMGLSTAWVSIVADNPLGQKIINKAREHNVDTSSSRRSEQGRVGLVYTEKGSAPRTTVDIEDMAGATFGNGSEFELDWSILDESRLLYLDLDAAIRYAGSLSLFRAASDRAQASDCAICVSLGDYFADGSEEYVQDIQEFCQHAEIILTTKRAAMRMCPDEMDLETLAERLKSDHGTPIVSVTDHRFDTPRICSWKASVVIGTGTKNRPLADQEYKVDVVDAAGANGAFAGGFLYGYLTHNARTGLQFGNATAALAHSVPGNISWATADDIASQLTGSGTKLQR